MFPFGPVVGNQSDVVPPLYAQLHERAAEVQRGLVEVVVVCVPVGAVLFVGNLGGNFRVLAGDGPQDLGNGTFELHGCCFLI